MPQPQRLVLADICNRAAFHVGVLKGLQQQMEPALEEFEGFAREIGPQMQSFFLEMGPAFKSLMDEVQDWSAYHPPEMLPNGDIILRRKVEEAPLDSAPDLKNETDL